MSLKCSTLTINYFIYFFAKDNSFNRVNPNKVLNLVFDFSINNYCTYIFIFIKKKTYCRIEHLKDKIIKMVLNHD